MMFNQVGVGLPQNAVMFNHLSMAPLMKENRVLT